MAKLILNEARAEQNLAEPSIESNVKYELGEELLNELRSNSYSRRVEEDVVGHIAKILEILKLIEVAGMDPFQLRMMTFPLSLSGKAKKCKFYPLSCASNYDKMCEDDEEGIDPLEFITWRNSKFKDHKRVDEITKRALLHSWIEVGNNEGIMDEDVSSDDDKDHAISFMIAKPELKIGKEFLKILHDNSFNGMDGSDVTNHIAKVLEITEWIKIPNVDKNELRLHVFSKLLSGDVEKWWNNEGTSTTWKELCKKFLYKYYPLSHTYKSKIPDDLDQGTDYFEFIYWLASKFDNYWELEKNIKIGLWEFYVNGRNKGTINDPEPCKEYSDKTCSDLFFKPYLDAQDGKDIYEIIDRDYSLIPILAHHDINNPDELCQIEEFTVVRNHTAYPRIWDTAY
ncbi:hypothetical protein Tco_1132497 [Tanacetum coccineum]|uniref:Uncharacterized protein n=1 Tax=Tanacetum coccineum TaxID=301880 RepID=A0ABQ5JD64_9ASTR